jgi:uncharacterized protein (DUF2461 family)
MIRPAIQVLIDRGNVHLDELADMKPEPTLEEAAALVPKLVNDDVSERIRRTAANTPKWQPGMPGSVLRGLALESAKRLEREVPGLAHVTNQDLAVMLSDAANAYVINAGIDPSLTIPTTYVQALYSLSVEAQARLEVLF